ncbi:MAG TPA: hypothetical protein VGL53_20445 [Bryobacteraceae bacterium]
MQLASTIARYLLGIIFTLFGLNGFLHFIPQTPPDSPLAVQYLTVLTESHYMVLPFLIQLIGGLLLLANRYVPLALVLLAPILVNILLFHSLMDPPHIGPGLLATILWFVVFIPIRSVFNGILQARV